MFIQLKSGAMFNLVWLQDCLQDKHKQNIVVFYTINGTQIQEEYDSATEAEDRVNEVRQYMFKALSTK